MTDLSPIECEARLVGLSKQRRKDGDWVEVKFHIHPDDHPAALFILPLGTACTLSIKGTPEGAAEAPGEQTALRPPDECADDLTNQGAATAPPKVKGGERARRAGILCSDPVFQSWYIGNINIAKDSDRVFFTANTLRAQCGIKSRAELDHNEEAARMFDQIERAYRQTQQGRTDPEVARQFAEGPS